MSSEGTRDGLQTPDGPGDARIEPAQLDPVDGLLRGNAAAEIVEENSRKVQEVGQERPRGHRIPEAKLQGHPARTLLPGRHPESLAHGEGELQESCHSI